MYDYPSQSPPKAPPMNDAFQQMNQQVYPPPPPPIMQQHYSHHQPNYQLEPQNVSAPPYQSQPQYAPQPYPQQYPQPPEVQIYPHHSHSHQQIYVPPHAQVMIIPDLSSKLVLPRHLDNYDVSTLFHCPQCNHESMSQVSHSAGSGTYGICCLLCCTTCVLCPLPFFFEKCKDKTHTCPVCAQQVGYKPFKLC